MSRGVHRNLGGWRVGESHQKSKLTTRQVWDIRQLYETGRHTYRSLAHEFNCGVCTIRDIVKYYTRGMG